MNVLPYITNSTYLILRESNTYEEDYISYVDVFFLWAFDLLCDSLKGEDGQRYLWDMYFKFVLIALESYLTSAGHSAVCFLRPFTTINN